MHVSDAIGLKAPFITNHVSAPPPPPPPPPREEEIADA